MYKGDAIWGEWLIVLTVMVSAEWLKGRKDTREAWGFTPDSGLGVAD